MAIDSAIDLDGIFRRCSKESVALLVRSLGSTHIDLAENAVQEALLKAFQLWPTAGIPENPRAWVFKVAKNFALDHLRRDRTFNSKEEDIREAFTADYSNFSRDNTAADQQDAIWDHSLLKMIFLSCHPALTLEEQVALTLKVTCGFGVHEIARAFVMKVKTIQQRLVRAKTKLKAIDAEFELPEPQLWHQRLSAVLAVIYLQFNEGYAASNGERHVQEEICFESIAMLKLLAAHDRTDNSAVHALMAVLCFQASRLRARCDSQGELVLLKDQDRNLWDTSLIHQGFRSFAQSIGGDAVTPYHIQASIAFKHASSPSYDDTDWEGIIKDYDLLLEMQPHAVVAINRLVAVLMAKGPNRCLQELAQFKQLFGDAYPQLSALEGEIYYQVGNHKLAAQAFERSAASAGSDPERRFFQRRLGEVLRT